MTRVFVRPGQRVHRGQLLARVDDASLRQRLRSAESKLESVKARLANARQRTLDRHRQMQVWSERAWTVGHQQAALEDARTAAKEDKAAFKQRIAGTNQSLANPHGSGQAFQGELQATVDQAQRSLDHARKVSAADAASLEKQVAQARRAMARAQIAAQASKAGLPAAVDQAEQSLAGAQSTLSNDQEKLSSAQSDRDHYQDQVDSLRKKVDSHQGKVDSDKAALESCKAGLPVEGCTSLQKAYDSDGAALNDLKASLSTAESNLAGAKSSVSSLENTVASDQRVVVSAQSALTNAQQAQSPGPAHDAQTGQAAQGTLANAQEAAAQKSLDSAIRKSRSRLAEDRQSVRAAEASLAKARKRLASGSRGSKEAVQSVKHGWRSRVARDAQSIRTAAYSLRSAQQSLASSLAANTTFVPAPTAGDLAVAEIKVELAKLSVANARKSLVEGGVLTAPASGTVSAVSSGLGDRVSGASRAGFISLTDVDSLQVKAGFQQTEVAKIRARDEALQLEQRLRTQLAAAQEVAFRAHTGVVGIATRYLGIPYVWGGASPAAGFDCSGLVLSVYAQVGISLPHYAAAQYDYGVPVSRDQLEPGDLVFFNKLGHVGIYIGSDEFIHAPHAGDVVKISSLDEARYVTAYTGARRLESQQRSLASSGTRPAARRAG